MAIEIIPKPAQKLPLWQNILFYLSIALLIASITSYFALDYFFKKAEIISNTLEEALTEKTPAERVLEAEIFGYQKKINNFSQLINQHLYPSKFFDFFQGLSHPKVWFSEFNLNPQDNQSVVSGQAESFLVVGQQVLIFKQENLIQNVNLSNLLIGETGKIYFTINLSLNPDIFK